MPFSVELNLQGRVAVITGGARGMGAAYVRGFLDAGAKVVAADRSWAGAEAFQRELEGRGALCLDAELRERNVAVNVVVPGHTRTTGFDEQNQARLAAGARPGPQPYAPEHVVPVVLFLASQDAQGVTGKMFDAVQWNLEHGLGGTERWLDRSFSYDALRPD